MGLVSKAATNHYRLINRTWGEVKISTPTGLEAIEGARVLWSTVVGGWFDEVQLTSGNRYTWARHGVLTINPDRYGTGWSSLVHDLSHLAHNRINRKNGRRPRPHNFDQAKIERRMQQIVLRKLIK